jgi:uncharacterized protein (DUF924 family)
MSTIERTSDRTEPPWVEEVLRFWFQELGADLWFVTNDDLIGQLGSEDWTRYALAHQATIERFGRFPHRNAILGRTSRPDEVPFVDQSFSRKL